MTNKEIAQQFSMLAKLLDIHNEESFKAKSYANAAIAIDKLPYQIKESGVESLEGQHGIGKSTAHSILEIINEGKLLALDGILSKTPQGVIELLKIKGLGPKKISKLWKEFDIDSPLALLNACNKNELKKIKGFGDKSQQSIKEKVEFYFDNQNKLLWAQAEQLEDEIRNVLSTVCESQHQYALLGDYYWQNPVVETFYIVCTFSKDYLSKKVDSKDWEILHQDNNKYSYKFRNTIFFNFECVSKEHFEMTVFKSSFSAELYSSLGLGALEKFTSEQEAFKQLDISFMPPFLRNNPKAVEKAKEKKLANIIQEKDIKGVVHNHTNWSDGKHTIEEMAQACIRRGYEYFVLSDHSQTSFYANGLSPERIIAQQEEIDIVNEKLKPFRVFKSIECDILGDGSLDYEEEVLASFDLVVCSVHQNLDMTQDKAMSRLLHAIENPYCSILGHPTGRLLLTRAGYPIDHKEIIDACAENDVVIELNANPRRLDMDWKWIDYAIEQDVMISINPDAHNIKGIDDIRFGVKVAQKAMLNAYMNLSSFDLEEFEDFLMHQHQKRM